MKLIEKDALLAEIDRRIKVLQKNPYENHKTICHLDSLKQSIDTLEVKEVDVWKTVDNINPPQADINKIYCVFTNDRYILATVINHPKDEELLQWKCTEFPNHRYDMCEGDKYMQIV